MVRSVAQGLAAARAVDRRLRRKVAGILRAGIPAVRLERIEQERPADGGAISAALVHDYRPNVARDIAFHLTDWASDAAFLVALTLFPERFTAREINAGLRSLIIHAPDHLAAAAKLAGHRVRDTFHVGALDGHGATG